MKICVQHASIYGLVDTITFLYRYIGETNNVPRRYKEHLKMTSSNVHKNEWIQSLFEKGLQPHMLELYKLQNVTKETIWQYELAFTRAAYELGMSLLNFELADVLTDEEKIVSTLFCDQPWFHTAAFQTLASRGIQLFLFQDKIFVTQLKGILQQKLIESTVHPVMRK